jgi:hypothetical protein
MRLSLLVLALALLAVPAAQAAGWKRVTTADQSSIDQPGLVRTADGVLHLAWSRATGPNTEDLNHTAILRNGRLGATSTIAAGWTGFANAALVVDPGGLRAFVGAIRSTTPGEPNDELNTLVSADGGGTWVLQPGNVVPDGAQAYGYPVAAATRPSGETLQTWAGSLGTWVHQGLSPATPNFDYQAPHGLYGYDSNVAVDAGGNAMLAWYSSGSSGRGVLAQAVGPDGAPAGAAMTMPGTGGMTTGMLGLTPLVARPGGGFFAAYPVGRSVRVWRVGADVAPVVTRPRGTSPAVTLAATGDGRLWLAWVTQTPRGPRVLAARSNRSVSRFGEPVNAGRPRGSQQAYRLSGSAAGGRLDVLANFNFGTEARTAIFHRRLLPGLTLSASPSRLRRGVAREVRFTVTDAGARVPGARVRVGQVAGRTGQNGRVTLRLPGRSATASATKSGYTRATLRLRAVRRG